MEAHLTTKLAALLDRPDSLPGEKDRYEIIGLLRQDADVARVGSIATEASSTPDRVPDLLDEAFDLLAEYRPLASERTWGKKDRRWLAQLRRKIN